MAYIFSHLILLSPSHKVSVSKVLHDLKTMSQLAGLLIDVFWVLGPTGGRGAGLVFMRNSDSLDGWRGSLWSGQALIHIPWLLKD